MIKKAIASLLSAFLFCGIFSITASAQKITRFGKEICQKYAELYYAGDKEALQEFINENMVIDGGGSSYVFPEEMLQALRDRSDTLIVIDYEANVYQLDSKTVYPKKDWVYCRFDFITGDGNEYSELYVLRDSGTFIRTLKSIVYYSGIEDPENIVQASFVCLDHDIKVTNKQFYDCKVGWNEVDGNRVYVQKNGFTATKSTTIDGVRYRFDENSVCQGKYTGKVKSGNNVVCYKDGVKQENELFTGWIKFGGKRFYAQDDVIQTGWVNISPYWYYIDPKEGRLTGTHEIDGASCTFDQDGKWDRKTKVNTNAVYNYIEYKMDKNLFGGVFDRDGMIMVWSVNGKAEKKLQKRYPNSGGIYYMEAKYSMAEMNAIPQHIRAQDPDGITSYYVDVFNNRLKLGFTDEQLKRIQPYLDSLENKDCIVIVNETGVIFYDD